MLSEGEKGHSWRNIGEPGGVRERGGGNPDVKVLRIALAHILDKTVVVKR